MRADETVGRVYRRCGCRDEQRRQLGAHCPQLISEPWRVPNGTRTRPSGSSAEPSSPLEGSYPCMAQWPFARDDRRDHPWRIATR
ncbi:hypothetical protein [Streptomyces rapamycinicus]|uniref:Uncharacterized protein n=2 Tax=Streptomyces rapamycinicus TaxID=1226757 RepID=A0A3L8RCD5_STRRN|nr:hypothetical protein [Streptomyces rapamycinicus]MBB4787161.1 hypothetical protein [Streptomyces rapamycinicus]RLV77399.1 hypothetical protein D3C57_103480 [Streptomyces rapamycinicus NRRL 5491]UTO67129.1 hypothetical protein LJB45_35750 [Streptomyces rapamycinicus]UTP35086.1 hypothetical protein LIV37_40895 [Streptomyces rapamycinicus NRRL 5491]